MHMKGCEGLYSQVGDPIMKLVLPSCENVPFHTVKVMSDGEPRPAPDTNMWKVWGLYYSAE